MTIVSLKLVHFTAISAYFSAFTCFGTLVSPRHTSSLRMTNRSHYFLNNYFGTISSKMYISTSLTTKQTFQATNPNKANHNPVFQTYSNTVTQYTSFNVKPTKMLSDPVAEAFSLIHRHPSGKNLLANSAICCQVDHQQIIQHGFRPWVSQCTALCCWLVLHESIAELTGVVPMEDFPVS